MLLTKDTETFRAKLDEALDAFHGGQRGTDYDQESQPGMQPQIENGVQPVIEPELPPETRTGESSTENDDVPY